MGFQERVGGRPEGRAKWSLPARWQATQFHIYTTVSHKIDTICLRELRRYYHVGTGSFVKFLVSQLPTPTHIFLDSSLQETRTLPFLLENGAFDLESCDDNVSPRQLSSDPNIRRGGQSLVNGLVWNWVRVLSDFGLSRFEVGQTVFEERARWW